MGLDYYEDEEKDMKAEQGSSAARKDFDCPTCNANNPGDDPLVDGMEVLCNYCGSEFSVKVQDGGRIKFREI